MAIQTVEIHGERFVLIPEREFLALQSQIPTALPTRVDSKRFRDITPLRVGGVPASDLLIQDRR